MTIPTPTPIPTPTQTPTPIPTLRRYQSVVSVAQPAGGFAILLDTAPIQTPAGAILQVPTQALAAAIAAEWAAQTKQIRPDRMPFTQLAMTAQDLPVERASLLAFLATDLIAHYAEEPALRLDEEQHWQPLHNWLREHFDAVLPTTIGVLPSRETVQAGGIGDYLASLDPYRLLALRELASTLGSLVMALALVQGVRTIAATVAAATTDSTYQMRRWGADPALLQQQADLQVALETLCRFLKLLD